MVETRPFPSKSNPGRPPYQLRFNRATGEIIWCDCPAYRNAKGGGPRTCPHERAVRAEFGTAVAPAEPDRDDPPPTPPAAPAAVRIRPMLASPMEKGATIERFQSDAFVLEEKFDGDRVMVRVQQGRVSAWSRPQAGKEPNGRQVGATWPKDINAAFAELPDGVYDGELLLPGTTARKTSPRCFVCFDVVELLGHSLTGMDYDTRRQHLKLAIEHHRMWARLGDRPVVIVIPEQMPVSRQAVEAIWGRGGEGAIVKRRSSTYQPGYRSKEWVKVKRIASDVLTIVGFEAGKLGPYAVTQLRSDDGRETKVPTKDAATRRAVEADPSAFIGKRLVIYYTEKTESGSWRHAGWDHLEGGE